MKVVLVRHGDAVSSDVDPARPLSQRGRDDVKKVGKHLGTLGIRIAEIRHSTKARAVQTASIIAAYLPQPTELKETLGLSPNDPVKPVAREIERLQKDLMIVGHLPFLPSLAMALLEGTGSSPRISFPAAGVVILVRDTDGVWSVDCQIWPGKLEG